MKTSSSSETLSSKDDTSLFDLEKGRSKSFNFEQSSRPCTFDPRNILGRLTKGYHMIIRKGTNRMVLFRFLLAKTVYSPDGISLEEYLLLYTLYFTFEENGDPLFQEKYKEFLVKALEFLTIINEIRFFPIIPTEEQRIMIKEFFQGYLPSAREYFGLCGQRNLRDSYRLVLHDAIEPRRFPPKKIIGVGYKDKGTRRNTAVDGSPSWKEVASFFSYRDREAEDSGFPSLDSPDVEDFL